MKKEKLYSIGEISKICKIPRSALRYYDEVGVIKPCYIDEVTSYRYYGDDTLMQVPVLRYYQILGFKLKEIVQLLEREDLSYLKHLFNDRIDTQKREIEKITMDIASVASWRDLIIETEEVIAHEQYQVTLKELPATKMFKLKPTLLTNMTFENILINNEFCSTLYGENFVSLGPLFAVFPAEESRFRGSFKDITLYIKNYHKDDEFAMVVDVSGFTAVTCYHRGLHKDVGITYEKIKAWAKEHNFTLRGDIIERYVIDYWSIKNSDWFLTEIFFPIV